MSEGEQGHSTAEAMRAMRKDDEMGKHRSEEGLAGHMGTFLAMVRILFFN